MEIKTLFENPWVSVRQKGRWIYSHFTKSNSETVGILPYRMTDSVVEYGVIYETIPCHSYSFSKRPYLITGAVEDNNIMQTMVNEVEEEAGIQIYKQDLRLITRYFPLKHSDCAVYIAIIDVTGLEVKQAQGDGSEHEKEAEFKFISGDTLVEMTRDPNLVTAYLNVLNKTGGK